MISIVRIPKYMLLFAILASCSSRIGSELVVEQLSLDVREQFESRVPEFEGFLSEPIDCALDEDGRLYVLDRMENHVVVFDRDMVVVDIIGSRGDGPGELRIFPQSGYHHLDVDGGFVVVGTDPNLVHVFQVDGTFINRFIPEHICTDLIIKDGGRIVTHTFDEEFPIIEYDIHGNVLRRYGQAIIRKGVEYFGLGLGIWYYNRGSLASLSDNGLVTFNARWLRFHSTL